MVIGRIGNGCWIINLINIFFVEIRGSYLMKGWKVLVLLIFKWRLRFLVFRYIKILFFIEIK